VILMIITEAKFGIRNWQWRRVLHSGEDGSAWSER
jgi:hypothetical protein